jgi:diguanylate cyclase (GGDEF)-like protein
MELRRYLQIMWKGWWLILPAILVSVSVGLVITFTQTPIYRTTATFIVSPGASFADPYDVLRGLTSLSQREGVMSTYVEIAASGAVRNAVYAELGLTQAQKAHLGIGSELVPSTNIIKISVGSDDPALAKKVADAVGQQTTAYVKGLYEIYDMKPLDPAFVPRSPSEPQIKENLILAALLGMAVGVGSAFLLDYFRSSEGVAVGLNILDAGTGVYNRSYFLQRLNEELGRAKRHQRPLSLALMSVENLDMAPGMQPGLRNEALRRVGGMLKQYLREEDLLARFEGDTFALLFPDTDGPDAEQMLQSLHNRIQWNVFELEGGVQLNLMPSSGVVAYDLNGTGRDELVSKLTATLQSARDDGYGKVYLLQGDERGV